MKSGRILAALIAALLLAACGENGDDNKWYGDFGAIKISDKRQLEQTIAPQTTQPQTGVTFRTEGPWSSSIAETTRTGTPSWISISPESGDAAGTYTVSFTLSPNPGESPRTAIITIACNGSNMPISVTQTAPKEGGDDPAQRTWYKPLRIEQLKGGEVTGIIRFEYEELGKEYGRITSLKYYNAGATEPYTSYTFAYNDTELRFIETFTDKRPYSYATQASGGYKDPFSYHKTTSARRSIASTATDMSYQYQDEYLVQVCFSDPKSADATTWETHYRRDASNNCTQIEWGVGTGSANQDKQIFTYPTATTGKDAEIHRMLVDNRGICIPLLFVEEPDIFRALGFLGKQGPQLPATVTTTHHQTSISQEFSYSFSLNKIPAGGEGEGMRITEQRRKDNSVPDPCIYIVYFKHS